MESEMDNHNGFFAFYGKSQSHMCLSREDSRS